MVIGPPSDEQTRLFDHMVALQDIAFEAIRPGARCSDVDRAVRAYYEEHDAVAELAPPRRARDRAPLPRGAVPRPRRRHRDPPRHGLHRRAGALLAPSSAASATRTPSPSPRDGIEFLTYYPRDSREPDAAGLRDQRKGRPKAAFSEANRRRPTLPGGCPPSTIGPGRLNFSVRNGKRCFPAGMTAELSRARVSQRAPSKLHSDSDQSSNQDLGQLVRLG